MVLAENSWAKRGGVDDRCEIYGAAGFTRADLLRGSALLTYSQTGYGYAVEKAGDTRGYTFTMFEEVWNYGFPQELAHFCRCVQGKEKPMETGEDGRAVLEIIYAAYQSAGEGRKIAWPYTAARRGQADRSLEAPAGGGRAERWAEAWRGPTSASIWAAPSCSARWWAPTGR